MITILDNILTINECRKLIDFWEDNITKADTWGNPASYPLTIYHSCDPKKVQINNKAVLNLLDKINLAAKQHRKDIRIDWAQIVKWFPTTYMEPHTDFTSADTVLTSVLYLNDNYDGGKTYFPSIEDITPKAGKMVVFDGKQYKHGVSEILNGFRYTLPIWYKIKE
jgi:hypothetical protein